MLFEEKGKHRLIDGQNHKVYQKCTVVCRAYQRTNAINGHNGGIFVSLESLGMSFCSLECKDIAGTAEFLW